ncbi:FabD/lysophospholipase-like protein [Serendipita vermifera]|nr:FabD/lysophospholipase-like protein [Serendipita vermifera]
MSQRLRLAFDLTTTGMHRRPSHLGILRYSRVKISYTRSLKVRHFAAKGPQAANHRSLEKSWMIWAPLVSLSTVFLASTASAEYRANLRHAVESPDDGKVHQEATVEKVEESWTQPLASLFGLDAPTEETKDLHPIEEKPAGLGWRGLHFIRESLSIDSIPSITASWIWPESIVYLQSRIQALLVATGRGPGSLYAEIVESSNKAPEIGWDAHVRLGEDLCVPERAFLRERKRVMRKAFAKYVGVDEKDINEEDIPIVAIAASGGGYRAMTNTTGSLVGAKESGILDCTTYIAGISGSCWALGVLYSGIATKLGIPDPIAAAGHIKDRVSKSFFDTITLDLLTTPPTNKYLLAGLLLKATAPLGSVSLTDIYGTLISSRLFVPSDIVSLNPDNLSLHKFRRHVDDGSMPLPIFTAIQHEIPHETEKPLEEVKEQRDYLVDPSRYELLKKEEEELQRKTKWLWYEFTPYEVGCDELGAWVPSWAFGRRFENGVNIERRPELSFTILAGIYASAFCATLKDYFNEAQPILRQLPWSLYSWIAEVIDDNKEDFGAIHPVVPNQLPNFVKGLEGQLREGSPKDITSRETLGFMDAGAELNIPYYPLLRRNVDCIIALDASADSQDLWFTRAEEYAMRLGVSTWPKGARWPAVLNEEGAPLEGERKDTASADDDKDPNRRLAESQESQVREQTERQREQEKRNIPERGDGSQAEIEPTPAPSEEGSSTSEAPRDLASPRSIQACSIWIGSSKESTSENISDRIDDLTEEELAQRDGIGIVYMPLVPNPNVQPVGWDPSGISTWRREMDPDETDRLLRVAKMNFLEGDEKIRRLLRAMWLRKKKEREEREWERKKRLVQDSLKRHFTGTHFTE